MITANTRCAPNWVDLSTNDISSALDFYENLFGWKTERSATPAGDYFIAKIEGNQIGGMMEAGPGDEATPPTWTVFFNIADIDDTVDKIAAAGGSILQPPFPIPEAHIAIVADPVGAMFGLFMGPEIDGVWMSPRVGGVCWVETLNRDTATAESFYGQVFGWTAATQRAGGNDYTVFHLDGEPVAGMMSMPAEIEPEVPAHWGVYFTVADCQEIVTRCSELGGEVLKSTTDTEMGPFAVLADPQGAVFDVMEFRD